MATYQPPPRYPITRKGYYVACPVGARVRTAMSKGKIRTDAKGDYIRSREICLTQMYETCAVCPHSNFETIMKNIANDYSWLDTVVKQIVKVLDAEVKSGGRDFGDCCPEHSDCVLCHYTVDLKNSVVDRDTAKIVNDIIMKMSRRKDVPHKVVHVKVLKQPVSFDLTIALKPK